MAPDSDRHNKIVNQLIQHNRVKGHFLFKDIQKSVPWTKVGIELTSQAETNDDAIKGYVDRVIGLLPDSGYKGVVVDMELGRNPNFTLGQMGVIPEKVINTLSERTDAKQIDCLIFSNSFVRDGDIMKHGISSSWHNKFRNMYVYYWDGKNESPEWIDGSYFKQN
ncbi:hypothetical protein [Floridanema aerugineum]|uniref:Uncharacterized protein n=1 Tax=Floridaenema aerugineum BLCC-F46 TaxID=3153654 RepID=A0ABV4XCP7_9CYAN